MKECVGDARAKKGPIVGAFVVEYVVGINLLGCLSFYGCIKAQRFVYGNML